MRWYSISWFAAGFMVATVVAGSWQIAHARDRYSTADRGYVVTESLRGGNRIAGPVRSTRLGPQVRLPGGSWVYCERSCAETLRANTVDFWEAQLPGAGASDGPQGLSIYVWPR